MTENKRVEVVGIVGMVSHSGIGIVGVGDSGNDKIRFASKDPRYQDFPLDAHVRITIEVVEQ